MVGFGVALGMQEATRAGSELLPPPTPAPHDKTEKNHGGLASKASDLATE